MPLNISVFNESTAIPFTRFMTSPIHPGIQVGTEFALKSKNQFRLFQTLNIYYFYHKYLTQGIGLNSELGAEYRTPIGLAFSGLLGIGYLHTFATAAEYTFSNGEYTKKGDRGNARITPTFSLETGYYLHKSKPNSPKIFIRYQSWIEYPYSPDFIPLMTHINLHVGIRIIFPNGSGNEN